MYSEHSQTFGKEFFAKIAIFLKDSILNIWVGSERALEQDVNELSLKLLK